MEKQAVKKENLLKLYHLRRNLYCGGGARIRMVRGERKQLAGSFAGAKIVAPFGRDAVKREVSVCYICGGNHGGEGELCEICAGIIGSGLKSIRMGDADRYEARLA